MAEGMSLFMATGVLNALGNASPFVCAQPWIQLHTGPPGSAGTAAVAPSIPRMLVPFANAGQSITNDAAITWTNVQGAADPTHFSMWDAAAGGNFFASGVINSVPYAVGNTLNIPSGALVISFTIAT